ncbi:MAG: hypothetical protein EAZ89_04080, partial [Bacteroidetes bacterium]
TSGTNPVDGQVCYTPPCALEGDTVRVIVGGKDPADCPGYNIVYDTVTVVIGTYSKPLVSHTFTGGGTGDTLFVNPLQNVCYTLNATDPDVGDILTAIPVSGPFGSVGGNASVTLSGTNPLTGQVCWQPTCANAGQTFTFIVAVQDINRCNKTSYDTVTVVVAPLTNKGANGDGEICFGQNLNLQAFGGATYAWSPAAGLSSAAIANPVASPALTTNYQVTITDAFGCQKLDTVQVIVNQLPPANAGPDVVKCPGIPVPLQATGGISYVWTPAATLSNAAIANPVANPQVTTTYTVTVTDGKGCSKADQVTIQTYYAAAGPSQTICVGDTVQISASNGVAYQWISGTNISNAFIANPLVAPTTTTVYEAQVTGPTGCLDTVQVTVNVNPLPPANAGPDTEICFGLSVPLSASGGVSYVWTPAQGLSSTQIANPIASPLTNSVYQVTVTDANGCVKTDLINVTVNPLPVANAGPDLVKCGDPGVTLSGSGAIGFQWSPLVNVSNPLIANPVVSPDSSTTYILTVTDAEGCQDTDSVFVRTMYANAGPDLPVCIGDSVAVTASGGIGYQWDPSPFLTTLAGPATVAFPADTMAFSLTVTDISGCSDKDTMIVIVNPLPTTSTFGSDPYVCSGGGTVVTATGGVIYAWSPAAIFDDPTLASPVASPTYSGATLDSVVTFYVMVTDTNGCSKGDSLKQTVRLLPILTVSNDTIKCPGDTIQLQSTGGIAFLWKPAYNISNTAISNPFVSPDTTTTYTVAVTAVWGCADSLEVTVTVIDPQAGPDVTICRRDSVQLGASGGVGYSWSPATGLSNPNIANPMASPAFTTTYIVTVTDVAGCFDTDTMTVFVNQLPPAFAGVDQAICIYDTAQLQASGGVLYHWLNASGLDDDSLANPIAFPLSTQSYSVAVTDTNGCTELDTMVLTINPLPPAEAGPTLTKCGEPAIQLQASGGVAYVWTPNLALNDPLIANPLAAPDSNQMYTVTVTDLNGCVNTDSVQVLTFYARTAPGDTICFSESTVISASHIGGQAVAYSWSPAASALTPALSQTQVAPAISTTYIVTITDSSGCADTASVYVRVLPAPPAYAGADTAICINDIASLRATGGISYRWDNEPTLSNLLIANPTANPRTTT